jgi:hypothetical protein
MYPSEIKLLMFPPLHVEYGKNTTSIDYQKDMYDPTQLSSLLARYSTYKVLCMHHMDMTVFYRACKVNRYFMMDPQIERLFGKEVHVFETSVSCNATFRKKRNTCVQLKWKDELENNLSGIFCSDVAINIQLSIDEFRGNFHCKNDESNR